MVTVADIAAWMEAVAPLGLSEEWDNTGLLLGDPAAKAERVMTCLTLTENVVEEAIVEQANLVIAHHPLPFRPLKKITTSSMPGRLLWRLASAGISVYSPHTAWDSAHGGINDQLGRKLGIPSLVPLVDSISAEHAGMGAGRFGELPISQTLAELSAILCSGLADCRPRGVDCGHPIRRVAVACGSGGNLLPAAIAKKCDLFVTGEATFHHCLEAQAHGMSLLMIGHFASERFSVEHLADELLRSKATICVWAARCERDPVKNLGT